MSEHLEGRWGVTAYPSVARTFAMIPFLLFFSENSLFPPFLVYFKLDCAIPEFIPPSTSTSYSAASNTTGNVFATRYMRIWRLSLNEALRDESTRRLNHGNAGRRPNSLVGRKGQKQARDWNAFAAGPPCLVGRPPI